MSSGYQMGEEEDDDEELHERRHIQKIEEIRIALEKRDNQILHLQKQLTQSIESLNKYRKKCKMTMQDLIKSENSLVTLRNSLISTQNELGRSLVDVKRLNETENKLRSEIKAKEAKHESAQRMLEEQHNEEVKALESRRLNDLQRMIELENNLKNERDIQYKLNQSLLESTGNLKDMERSFKEEKRKANEMEMLYSAEIKRVQDFELKYKNERDRANAIERKSNDSTNLLKSQNDQLKHHISTLEEKIESNRVEYIESEKRLQEKIENITKELKQKNATAFELENKLNGALFVAERKVLQVEREADAKVTKLAKHAADAHRTVAEREKKAIEAIKRKQVIAQKAIKLESTIEYLYFQRDWFIASIGILTKLLPLPPITSKTLRFKGVAWAVVFIVSLNKKSKQKVSFFWAASSVLQKSKETLGTRVSNRLHELDKISGKQKDLVMVKLRTKELEETLMKRTISNQELSTALKELEAKHSSLVHELKSTQSTFHELDSENEKHQEKIETLVATIESLERERRHLLKQLETENKENDLTKGELVRQISKYNHKLKKYEAELESANKVRMQLVEKLKIMKSERDQAQAEAKSAKEMVIRLENYAESEISSLTKLVHADLTTSTTLSSLNYM